MNGFLDDFKYAWNKPNNGMVKIVIINVAVFIVLNIFWLASKFSGGTALYESVFEIMAIPPDFSNFAYRPWTLLTYFFTHQDFLHILFNMLIFYWFAQIFDELLGSKKLVGVYFLGGFSGGLGYLAVYNLIPYFQDMGSAGMIGASASVYAVVVGAATVMPDYRMHLLFFGPVKIKYIAAVYIFLSFIGLGGMNMGGNIAHLAGALVGFLYIKQLNQGSDWTKPVTSTLDFIPNLLKPKPKIKVSFKKDKAYQATKASYRSRDYAPDDVPNQDLVDAILDKISESGYERLTAEEKHILFKASQRNG